MELAAIFGVLWCISVLCFIFSASLSIPPFINPLLLYILMAAFLFNPTKTCRHEARFWTIRILTRVALAPFFYVNFADFWIGDQLNSLVPAFLDLQYFFCFYMSNVSWERVDGKKQTMELIQLIMFCFHRRFAKMRASSRRACHRSDAAGLLSLCTVFASIS